MNFLVAFLLILINIISIVSLVYSCIKKKEKILILTYMVYLLTISILGAFATNTNENISAIDVYRGKTTLEITYKDNIPIDSVVVYKNKK